MTLFVAIASAMNYRMPVPILANEAFLMKGFYMKKISFIVVSLFIFTSFCGSAIYAQQSLIKVQQSGGYCMGPCPVSVITILDNGWVTSRRDTFNPIHEIKTTSFAWLSNQVINSLKNEIANISNNPSELYDVQEGQPVCADAPQKIYSIVNANYQEIQIGKDMNCHQYRLKNGLGYQLVEIIDSFMNMSSMTLR